MIYGIRSAFDDAVVEAQRIMETHNHPVDWFQPYLEPEVFAPCVTYGGDSARSHDVAWKAMALLGYHRVVR